MSKIIKTRVIRSRVLIRVCVNSCLVYTVDIDVQNNVSFVFLVFQGRRLVAEEEESAKVPMSRWNLYMVTEDFDENRCSAARHADWQCCRELVLQLKHLSKRSGTAVV